MKARRSFADRAVLITGAAGSIGAGLAREIAALGCRRLCLVDHFDHGLLAITDELRHRYPHLRVDDALCDVRSAARLGRTFADFRPDIVLHAAALKHVHLGESHPGECVLTNLVGVRNAARAAQASGAETFLLVSSDKAASPVCTMGVSKRLAELYVQGLARTAERAGAATRFKIVRFGNVYGSQGSVVPKFLAQIAAGGPVEVTHPDMQRFFMSLADAVDLILTISLFQDDDGSSAGLFMLDMGPPVKIVELARKLIEDAGAPAEIKFIGVRAGEKLSEDLWDEHEFVTGTPLPGVLNVQPLGTPAYLDDDAVADLENIATHAANDIVRARAFELFGHALSPAAQAERVLD
jgi:O-antigen biosynthesis protein WbqV